MPTLKFKGKQAQAVLDALTKPRQPTKAERVAKELCEAAEAFQEAVNMLWWAKNPEERESPDGIYPDEAEWEETHSERFGHLTASIYEVRKTFGFPDDAAAERTRG